MNQSKSQTISPRLLIPSPSTTTWNLQWVCRRQNSIKLDQRRVQRQFKIPKRLQKYTSHRLINKTLQMPIKLIRKTNNSNHNNKKCSLKLRPPQASSPPKKNQPRVRKTSRKTRASPSRCSPPRHQKQGKKSWRRLWAGICWAMVWGNGPPSPPPIPPKRSKKHKIRPWIKWLLCKKRGLRGQFRGWIRW